MSLAASKGRRINHPGFRFDYRQDGCIALSCHQSLLWCSFSLSHFGKSGLLVASPFDLVAISARLLQTITRRNPSLEHSNSACMWIHQGVKLVVLENGCGLQLFAATTFYPKHSDHTSFSHLLKYLKIRQREDLRARIDVSTMWLGLWRSSRQLPSSPKSSHFVLDHSMGSRDD